jgi:hypothetical protein
MPPVSEQIALPESTTNPHLIAARFLLKPGRKYDDAVEKFKPYDKTKEINEEAREAIKLLFAMALKATGGDVKKALIFINNRLEGNALNTIAAILGLAD